MCHGLYPTSEPNAESWHWGANRAVVNNLIRAKAITVPSEWVADILRRDMHLEPDVIGWAIEPDEWTPPDEPGDYVLWNKTRTDGVCHPDPLLKLAALLPAQKFLSTFGDGATRNVRVIGRQPFERMRDYVRHAAVYLATTKETFGIGVLEAMACGVPVLGYRHGAVPDYVQHGVHGYLVEPGDIEGLREGLAYCLKHRAVLGANARRQALRFTWQRVAERIASVYDRVLQPRVGPKVSVIIPVYNYARFVTEAIESVAAQRTAFQIELLIVDDGSTDGSRDAARRALDAAGSRDGLIEQANAGVAAARNRGIARARGEYIVCLDADDRLGSPDFLQTLADALDADRSLGVVFTGLTTLDEDGTPGALSRWPAGYDFDRQVDGHNQVPTCCMFRKEAWQRAGGYKRQYTPAEDARLWLEIGALGYRAQQVTTEGWFHYRLHGNSLSSGVRTGQRPEPNWRAALPWIHDGKRPFASDGRPFPNPHSWPVRNYDRPLVSFVVPVGPGHTRYLQEALDSIEGQTERRWECIVVNDTGEPLHLPSAPWARVVETGGKRGAGYARNCGIKAASAPLVAFLDADDILEPRFLELSRKAHNRTGRYSYTDWVSLNKQGQFERHVTPEYAPRDVFYRMSLHSINVLIPKQWLVDVGGFDETMPCWEDVDLFMKLAAAGYCGTRVPEPLVVYRYTTGQLREHGETIKDDLKALLRERYGGYMEGKVACGCKSPPKATSGAPTVNSNSADMVRVEYTWDRAPAGKVPLRGAATGASYGMRARGETFYVWNKDYQAMKDRFTPVMDPAEAIAPTAAPPEPVLIS